MFDRVPKCISLIIIMSAARILHRSTHTQDHWLPFEIKIFFVRIIYVYCIYIYMQTCALLSKCFIN